MTRFAGGWAALVAWSIVTFTLLERVHPRHHVYPGPRRIAGAAVLLAIDAAIAVALVRDADLDGRRVVAGWLAVELAHYGLHRAMHAIPLLWRCHRLHHEGPPLAWPTTWYVHPIDAALTASVGLAVAALVGGGAAVAGWFVVGRRVWTIVLHANLAWPASRLDHWIATPAFHARHHREDLAPAHFAATLPVLDRLFGTVTRVAGRGKPRRP